MAQALAVAPAAEAAVEWTTELRDHARATRSHVGGRRVQQRAVIGERDVIQVLARVVRIERAPAAVAALQTHHPLATAGNCLAEVDAS